MAIRSKDHQFYQTHLRQLAVLSVPQGKDQWLHICAAQFCSNIDNCSTAATCRSLRWWSLTIRQSTPAVVGYWMLPANPSQGQENPVVARRLCRHGWVFVGWEYPGGFTVAVFWWRQGARQRWPAGSSGSWDRCCSSCLFNKDVLVRQFITSLKTRLCMKDVKRERRASIRLITLQSTLISFSLCFSIV